jgi:hypothetical protein
MSIYNLKIYADSKNHLQIDKMLGVNGNKCVQDLWIYELTESDDDQHVEFIEIFYGLLNGRFSMLESVGVSRDEISIWALYGYESHFNIELVPSDLILLGKLGVTFCISCGEIREK